MSMHIEILEERKLPFRKSCDNCTKPECRLPVKKWNEITDLYGVENVVCNEWEGIDEGKNKNS